MSTREKAYYMIDRLNEEQLNALVTFLSGFLPDEPITKTKKKSAADLCGIFHDVADPEKAALEKTAWEQAAIDKHIRISEESANEDT